VTEAVGCGTSRNTGSDKQTYYKLGLGGDSPDSVAKMAENLFSCGSVDGDNALCEAALSVRSFLNLCELGV
ncbi:MAG: oxidoreductase, partial [Clostridia bacterium]|nr:oxidoreductase [Clostridia bacterium]